MMRLFAKLRRLRDERLGSVPMQYAIVASATAIITLMIVETTGKKVADKLNAVSAALSKVQF
jgi:phosphate starvation-inducible membrane PsiE